MASGKKGKKTKGKTLALTDFLQETDSLPNQPIRKSTTSWADEVDDYDAADTKFVNVVLPTAPKASRDFEDIADKVPKEPPFMAYLSNLPYDVDESEIIDLFRNLKIANMRIPKDDRPGEAPKLRGFGYVEFEDRESLMSALIIPDTNIKNRRIRIEVAANAENDRRKGRMGDRMGGGADMGGDWRSTNRPEVMEDRRGGSNFGRDRERDGGSSFTREGMREGGREYGGFNRDREGFNRDREGFNRDREGFNRDREFGRDRDSGFNRNRDQNERPGAWREGDRTSFNDRGYSRGNFRDSERGDRYNRDDRDERRGGGGFRRYDENERNGGFTRSNNKPDDDTESTSAEPRQRPKLNLAPRTKPLDQQQTVKSESAVPAASIFGNAKPVDTAERERQIEEKLLKEQEERLRETSKDREKDKKENHAESVHVERGRPPTRRIDGDEHSEINNKEREPRSRDRRNDSSDDNRRIGNVTNDYKSPDQKKKIEKHDRPKREEKRNREEKEMPKFQEPEVPKFEASNKFALLDDASD
ncbi:hypothetical protein ABEB36_005056 [Hypothenemus hampei]|uniref:RRM domain-containing protein n=1 Tax=Hypothenemus hampei TaxID=57062 RepID=A0ABD1EZB6_HYPHA